MKYLERIYPWLLLAPVILPVIILNGLIYPYLVPKTLLFYAISLLATGVFLVLVAHKHPFFWNRLARWETWIPGALLVLAYSASYWGTDFYRSFWSLFVRGDGLLMLTCVVASFYSIVLWADRAFFERLLRAVAVVASFVALYGVGEWLMNGGRIGGLLGNAAFFAGYLGIAFFATILAAQRLPLEWRRAAYGGAALQLVAIVLSATRGTILALGVAGVAYLGYLVFAGKGNRRTVAAGMLVALVALGGVFFTFRSELSQVPFAPIARIASVSIAEADVANRLFVWENMLAEIRKAPLLGVGAEHIDMLFNRFYDPMYISEQWFDRSHNAFLDYAAQYGVGGLLLYLALIGGLVVVAMRKKMREYFVPLTLLAVTYSAQNFFVFDTVSSLWLFLALLAVSSAMSVEETRSTVEVPPWAPYAAWVGGAVLVALIIPASIRPARAAADLVEAYKYQLTDVPKEIKYLSRGVALGTYGDVEYGYQVYDMYTGAQYATLTGQERVDAYQTALSILTANFDRYPYDARTALYLAHVLTLAPEGVTVDYELLSGTLERSIRLSPKRSQPWYILANLSISGANSNPAGSSERAAGYAAARGLLERYIALVPTLSQPHFVLAELEYASGDRASARAEAEEGKKYYTTDLDTAKRAAGYYETVLDLENAAYFLEEVVRLEPGNTAAAEDLAKIRAYEQSKR